MPSDRNPHKKLTVHAEVALIRSTIKRFPGSMSIGYFFEIEGEKPGYKTFSWAFNVHRILSIRMSWRTGKLHMKQELVVDREMRSISFPIVWGGLNITFDESGETTLEGTAAHDFWTMLIGHSGEGIPKPTN
jgi:hypothetical protein